MFRSGLVLDVYDDHRGETFRSLYPSREQIPDLIKQATALDPNLMTQLPDDAFALVLDHDDGILRKFACIDVGNTALSVQYFLKTGQALPLEAQKVAAANLKTACEMYGLRPPDVLEKIALLGFVAKANPLALMSVPSVYDDAKENVHSVMSGKPLSDVSDKYRPKMAEMTGSSVMPLNKDPGDASVRRFGIQKKGMGHLVSGHSSDDGVPPVVNGVVQGEQPKSVQPKVLRPHVTASSSEIPQTTGTKKASVYALRGRYPLGSYNQVKAASAYFDEYGKRMSPEDRRVYCQNMVKRAESMGVPVSYEARKYASDTYAPTVEVQLALDCRRTLLDDKAEIGVLDKLAMARTALSPDDYCGLLSSFDRAVGLHHFYDSHVPDPFFSTYGYTEKTAYMKKVAGMDVDESVRRKVDKTKFAQISAKFGEEVANEFRSDPVGIFDSLPLEQQQIIAGLAKE